MIEEDEIESHDLQMEMSSVFEEQDGTTRIDDHDQTNYVFSAAIENLSLTSSTTTTTTTATTTTTTTSSSSYSVIQQVGDNFDLLTQILLCLPVKSLLVFKSVSKQWLSLISDPSFAINHFRRRNPHRISKIHGLFLQKFGKPPPFEFVTVYDFLLLDGSRIEEEIVNIDYSEIEEEEEEEEEKEEEEVRNIYSMAAAAAATSAYGPFKNLNFGKCELGRRGSVKKNGVGVLIKEYGVRINHSCNGLLCCTRETEIINKIDEAPIFITHTYIYNPTTRQYKILPPSPFRDVVRNGCCFWVCSMSLVFDPINSPDHHYQVVCIFKDIADLWILEPLPDLDDESDMYYDIEIYSSKTNSWKKLISSPGNPFYALGRSFTKSGVYWNGSLHWITTIDNIPHESSMYFDIQRELLKPLPLPTMAINDYDNDWNCVYFGECGGHLYLIDVLKSCYTNYNILKMENDYSGWNLIYKLDLERMIAAYPSGDTVTFHDIQQLYRTALFLEEDEEESLSKIVWLVDGKKIISYDLKEMSVTEIHTFNEGALFAVAQIGGVFGYLHYYIESLACV